MMSIRSLADFNRSPLGGAVTGWHRHRHRPGLKLPADTANKGWGLLTGHHWGLRPGHMRGLSHGHGQVMVLTQREGWLIRVGLVLIWSCGATRSAEASSVQRLRAAADGARPTGPPP